MFANVFDSNGDPLTGLSAQDFSITDTGDQQSVASITRPQTDSQTNISVSLIIDRSGSMRGQQIEDARQAAIDFVNLFNSGDQGEIISFESQINIRQRWTRTVPSLESSINNISVGGQTALWDAITTGVEEVASRQGRSVVIVLTDGQDNQSSTTLSRTVDLATEQAVPVYTIGLGSGVNESDLRQLASTTGGEYRFAPSSSDLSEIYNNIRQTIADEYELRYETTNTATDGSQRQVELTATSGGATGSDTGTYESPCAPLPTARFSLPDSISAGQDVTFDGSQSSANGGSLVSYEWDFDNNGVTDGSGETTTHVYSNTGTYEARLTVEKTCGASDVTTEDLTVTGTDIAISIDNVNDPVEEGETLEVDLLLENLTDTTRSVSVVLEAFDGATADVAPIQVVRGQTETLTLEWETEQGDAGTDEIRVTTGEATVSQTVTIEDAPTQFEEQVSQKIGSGGIAEQIDNTSIIASASDAVGADVGDKPMATTTIDGLETAVENGDLTQETAAEAVRRMNHGEEAILKTLQFIGSETQGTDLEPGDDPDTIHYADRVAKYLVETLLAVLSQADSIQNVVFQRLPGWAQDLINLGGSNVLQALRDDLVTSFIGNAVSVGDAREETKTLIGGEANNIVSNIANGTYSTAQTVVGAIADVFDRIGDAIADFIQAGFETGSIQVVSGAAINTVGGLVSGSATVWGAARRINEGYRVDTIPASETFPGSTDTIVQSKNDGIQYIRELMDNSREWLIWIRDKILDFGIISNLIEFVQDVVDIAEAVGSWDFVSLLANSASLIINGVQTAIGILYGIAGLLTSAGAAAVVTRVTNAAGIILGQVITDILEGQQSSLSGFPNIPDRDQVFAAGGSAVPPWASEFANELESGI
ncbi:VWA domain-containing protein [Halorubrum ezzemoulense]|uniref:VWA domain-containing protein n=1 Tax=Halorubrum ezzemoulense TaxID=337243 RepID=UPI00232C931D|nr:VWA domain-containing protein [Halorubrum ezzemoulense]MDB2265826.1 VWA domain-containing protein [Halorubrum ezzemoulense]